MKLHRQSFVEHLRAKITDYENDDATFITLFPQIAKNVSETISLI